MAKYEKRRCGARRADGERCRAWAVRPEKGGRGPGEQPLCSAHGGLQHKSPIEPVAPGALMHEELEAIVAELQAQDLYADKLDQREVALMLAVLKEHLPEAELALARLTLRRMLGYMNEEEMSTAARIELGDTLVKGAERITGIAGKVQAMLEQKKQKEDDGIPSWMARALDSLGKEWDLPL